MVFWPIQLGSGAWLRPESVFEELLSKMTLKWSELKEGGQKKKSGNIFEMSLQLWVAWFSQRREIHPPVHGDSSECEHWHIDCDRLDEEHQVAHGAAKHPTAWVEGVGEGKGHAGHAHEHVREGQVSNEEVGDIVHLAGSADDVEEQVVPKDTHRHDQHVKGDDERLERLQQSHICKLGAAVGGVILHRDLINVSICLHAASQATVIALHGSKCTCTVHNKTTQVCSCYNKTWITFLKVKSAIQGCMSNWHNIRMKTGCDT